MSNTARRLISLTGFDGFKAKMYDGEVLVVQYEAADDSGLVTTKLDSKAQYDELVPTIDGYDLYGFYAIPQREYKLREQELRTRFISDEQEQDFMDQLTSIHRPTEEMVLGMVMRGGDLLHWLYLKYESHDRRWREEKDQRAERERAQRQRDDEERNRRPNRPKSDARRATGTHTVIINTRSFVPEHAGA